MPPRDKLTEKTSFKRDTETTFDGKNQLLAELLQGDWISLAIVQVKRIEIGDSGWEATYRE